MPGPSKQSRFMQRCVADVAKQTGDVSRAFAICTAQSQKSGYSEPGSITQTPKGAAREKQFKKQPDMGKKAAAYEKAVRRGKKAESMEDVFDEACATPGNKIRSGGRGRGLAIGDGSGPIGGRGRVANAGDDDTLCDDPGKRRRSGGKGRGLGIGRGRGPIGRRTSESMEDVFARLDEGMDNFRTLAKAIRDLRAAMEQQVLELVERVSDAGLPERDRDALHEHLMFACNVIPKYAERAWVRAEIEND